MEPEVNNASEEIDADALLNEIENPTSNEPVVEETPTQTAQEFEFNHGGRNIRAPLDKFQRWASQGYDYSQKMAQFNKERETFESEMKALNPFRDVDAYARKNPQWWQHVQQSFQQAQQQQQQGDPNDPISSALDPIKSEIQELRQWKQTLEESQQAYIRQQEDQQLDQEIRTVQEKYPDIPFNKVDEEGCTLEYKILKYGAENGIKSFKTAFHDYMAEELAKRAESRGREAVVKERQENARKGLLGRTQAPTKGIKPTENYRNKTYSDIERDALKELGLA